MKWNDYARNIYDLLNRMSVLNAEGVELVPDEAFYILHKWTLQVRSEKRTIYCIGNGASASIASHFSADMAKNGQLHTEVFFDLALMTAISNDLGYENVFSEPLKRRAVPGDMLVAISSSGNSPSILNAVCCAKRTGLKVITFSAMKRDNSLRKLGDLNFYMSAESYGDAESVHAAVLHYWINMFLENLNQREK